MVKHLDAGIKCCTYNWVKASHQPPQDKVIYTVFLYGNESKYRNLYIHHDGVSTPEMLPISTSSYLYLNFTAI